MVGRVRRLSRAIKFRGICIAEGEFKSRWVYGDLLIRKEKSYISPQANHVQVNDHIGKLIIMHEVNPETVCQLTGLKDRNGKEIYEGDIVKREWMEIHPGGGDFIGVVKYVEGSFCIEDTEDPYIGDSLFIEIGTNEVIGNIYEEEIDHEDNTSSQDTANEQ